MKRLLIIFLSLPLHSYAEDKASQCFNELDKIVAGYPIAWKMSLPDSRRATFEQLANTDKPNEYEKGLIKEIAEISKYCSELELKEIPADAYEAISKAMQDNYHRKIKNYIDLYNEKISYGEFISQRQESTYILEKELNVARAERDEHNRLVESENVRLNALKETQRRQELANTFGDIADSIRNSRPHKTTNCTKDMFGGFRCQ